MTDTIIGQPDPLVSVIVPTYRHAAYIEGCIEGILTQRTTFPMEIVIGEDESDDGTREICQRIAAEHPGLIRLQLRSRSDVIRINGTPTGRSNLKKLLREARGKYIAICEGDDLWIDKDKLQKQVDVLESDQSASLVFHNAWVKHDASRHDRFMVHGISGSRFTLEQVLVNEWFIATASIVVRTSAIRTVLDGFDTSFGADMVMQFHAGLVGDLVYLDEVYSIYRRHGAGLSDTISSGGSGFHENYVPNQIWTLWNFAMKVETPSVMEALRSRVSTLMQRYMRWMALATEPNGIVHIDVMKERMRVLLEKARPASIQQADLDQGLPLDELIEEAAKLAWSAQVQSRLRTVAGFGDVTSFARMSADMFAKGAFSKSALLKMNMTRLYSFLRVGSKQVGTGQVQK